MGLALFREKKDDIYELWRSHEGLASRDRREVLRFFDDFFRILEDPRRIESHIMRNCLQIPGG